MKEVKVVNNSYNKIKKIILGVLSLVLIILASILIFEKFNHEERMLTDAKKFAKEYTNVDEENIFIYASSKDILKILENGTGIIYFGYPDCKWCKSYVPILNEVAKEENIDKIYYYNIKEDRRSNTPNYIKITELLKDYLYYDDEGNYKLYAPDVTIVKNGKIIGHNNEGSIVTKEQGTPEEYFSEERKENLKNTLRTYIKELQNKQ